MYFLSFRKLLTIKSPDYKFLFFKRGLVYIAKDISFCGKFRFRYELRRNYKYISKE